MTRDELLAELTAERFGEPVREYRPSRSQKEIDAAALLDAQATNRQQGRDYIRLAASEYVQGYKQQRRAG